MVLTRGLAPSRSSSAAGAAIVIVACVVLAAIAGVAGGPAVFPTSAVAPAASDPVSSVVSFATSWRGSAADPLVEVAPGVRAKSSNVDGVMLGQTRYYYNLTGQPSFDPLGRGLLGRSDVQVVPVVGDPPNRVVIYTALTRAAQSR